MKWVVLDKFGKIVAKIEHAYSVTTSIFAYGFQQKIWNKLFNL